MAYTSSSLSALSYANGFTLWHYRTPDLAADIDDSGYFNEATKMLRVGDFILVNAGIESTETHGVVVVTANSNGTVDVGNILAFGTIDSD